MTVARLTLRPSPGVERGFILVAVLWILAALAAFTAVYAVYVSDTASAAAVRADALRAEGLAAAAVELAALRLLSAPPQKRPASGEVRFRMGGANISAVFADEAARIDLNAAAPEVLAGLFQALGVPEAAARSHAARIAAWRAPSSPGDRPAAGNDDASRGNGPFVHAAEIARIPGLPPDLVIAALPHVTVYAGRREVNPEIAGPAVRAALAKAGQNVDDADGGAASASGRPADGGGDGTAVASASGITAVAGDTARVTVRITFDNGRRHGVEAVLLLRDFGADPYRLLTWRELSWRELSDPGAAPARRGRTAAGGAP